MNYSDLTVWKESMQLVTNIYKLTTDFPNEEKYRLTDQMCRAAISIPSNIAEGHSRKSKNDFSRFLRISLGSCSELETQLQIACNLEYLTKDSLKSSLDHLLEIKKMLHGLIKSLN